MKKHHIRWMLAGGLAAVVTAVFFALTSLGVLADGSFLHASVEADPTALACQNGTLPSGALYRICMPTPVVNPVWNGELVLYAGAPGAPGGPLVIPEEATLLATLVNVQGFAFATTSYRTNGLLQLAAIDDLAELTDQFVALQGQPDELALVGVSQGGLVATLAFEQDSAERYSGLLAACSPIGDFQAQLDYFANFRLVFDYFFPGLMPGDAWDIPPDLMANWPTYFETTIAPVINDPDRAEDVAQVLAVTRAAIDPANSASIESTFEQLLQYNVMWTNDTVTKLGGIPFDNRVTVYVGSAEDAALNAGIVRVAGDAVALTAVDGYQTSGALSKPVVTLHTTLDPLVPLWHEPLYAAKVADNSDLAYLDQMVESVYGHCNFSTGQMQAALALLAERVANPPVVEPKMWGLFLPAVVRAD